MSANELNPRQHDVRSRLLALGEDRPRFGPELAEQLTERLRAALEPVAQALPSRLVVNKHALFGVHSCELRWLDEDTHDSFEWTVPKIRGTVTHRAIERSIVSRSLSTPLDLVESTIRRMADEESSAAGFLATLDDDRHDLLRDATDAVNKFLTDWPPIARSWMPRVESRRSFSLFEDRIVLSAKYDLALGGPHGTTARTMIVDLKSGNAYGDHAEELRFYALVETLVAGAPPFRVAAYYLDSGSWWCDDPAANPILLESAAGRLVDGVKKMADLRLGQREADVRPSPLCSYCRLFHTCEAGQAFERDRRDAA